jgi:Zn-dependent protease with chaperone function
MVRPTYLRLSLASLVLLGVAGLVASLVAGSGTIGSRFVLAILIIVGLAIFWVVLTAVVSVISRTIASVRRFVKPSW